MLAVVKLHDRPDRINRHMSQKQMQDVSVNIAVRQRHHHFVRLMRHHALAVRTIGNQRVKRIGYCRHFGKFEDFVGGQIAGISLAVNPFMVLVRNMSHGDWYLTDGS